VIVPTQQAHEVLLPGEVVLVVQAAVPGDLAKHCGVRGTQLFMQFRHLAMAQKLRQHWR
jgi:hypothetical protein